MWPNITCTSLPNVCLFSDVWKGVGKGTKLTVVLSPNVCICRLLFRNVCFFRFTSQIRSSLEPVLLTSWHQVIGWGLFDFSSFSFIDQDQTKWYKCAVSNMDIEQQHSKTKLKMYHFQVVLMDIVGNMLIFTYLFPFTLDLSYF